MQLVVHTGWLACIWLVRFLTSVNECFVVVVLLLHYRCPFVAMLSLRLLAIAVFLSSIMAPKAIRLSGNESSAGSHTGPLRVGFLFFDGYEVLDAAGPMELFAALAKSLPSDQNKAPQHRQPTPLPPQEAVEVFSVAEHKTVSTPVCVCIVYYSSGARARISSTHRKHVAPVRRRNVNRSLWE